MEVTLGRKIEKSWLYYAIIALFCMNFLEKGSIVCLVLGLFILIKLPIKIKFDLNFFAVLLLTGSIACASLLYYSMNEVIKSVNFLLMYIVGTNGYRMANDKSQFIKNTIFAIFCGFFINILLTYFYNLRMESIEGYRIIYSFWTKEPIAVTLVGLFSSVIIGYSFYCLFCQKKFLLKILAIISLIFMFLINFSTATRTPIILFFILYLTLGLTYAYNKSKKISKAFWGIVVAVAVLLLLFQMNIFGIKTYILSTPLFNRLQEEGMETSRWAVSIKHFKNMFQYLWGNKQIENIVGMGAHNFIQEAHDLYGIFATISLLVLSFYFIKNIVKIFSRKNKTGIDFLLLSMYLCMIIQMCMEPVFTGYPILIWALLLIHGITNKYLEEQSKALYENCSN